MRAEILSIGTELLLGQITDTNAVYLAQQLAALGIPLFFMDTVGDNRDRLQHTLALACSRSELIICTGGLGPTEDDITAAGIAEAFDAPLAMHGEARTQVEAVFRKRGFQFSEKQLKQAMIPHGALVVPNPVGTAPGFLLEKDGRIVIALPGPPIEMQPMWEETVAPFLARRSGAVILSRTLRFCGIGESTLETLLHEIIAAQTNPTVAPYAKLGEVHIRVTARAATPEEAQRLIAPVEAEIRARAASYLYGIDDDTLEMVVGRLLHAQNATLAVAESCTGGLLGGRLTAVAGSSAYFAGGVIAYSNAVKQALLGVSRATLDAHGAVSEPTACAMAEGIMRALGTSVGVSITGIAGPGGGSDEKPVGLVYIGLAGAGRPTRVTRYQYTGGRQAVRARAVQDALVLLYKRLAGQEDTL